MNNKIGLRRRGAPGDAMRHASSRAGTLIGAVLAASAFVPCDHCEAQAVQSAEPLEDGGALQQIVVTAQRRAQNPQDVGISLSVLGGDELDALGVVNASDITKTMPAVMLTQPNGPSSFSLSIRGVTQNDFADHQESPTAIYVDDVYVSQMTGLAFGLFDVDRVEVLRGPQGTLFGRNATGGLANFISRRPTDQNGGYIKVVFGERNLTQVEGAVNGRLWQDVDARLSFESSHHDPLFRNPAGGAADAENGNDWALRGQILFEDMAGGELLLIARGTREDVRAGSWEEYATNPGPNGYDTLLGQGQNVWGTCNGCNASGLTNSGPFVTRDNQAGYARLKTGGLTGKYTAKLGGAALTVIGDYSTFRKNYQEDSDASPFTVFHFFNGSDASQGSLEARLNGGAGRLNWTAGLYGLRIAGDYYEGWQGPSFFVAGQYDNCATNPNAAYSQTFYGTGNCGAWPYAQPPGSQGFFYQGAASDPNGGQPATNAPYRLITRSYAAFGQLEDRLTQVIGLTFGARFTKDRKDYRYTWYPYEYFPQNPTGTTLALSRPDGVLLNDYANSRDDGLWSGKAQVDLHLSRNLLTYVSYNRGVKGGGFSAPLFPATINDLSTLTFKPETLISYEAGFKSESFHHTLRLNGAVYYYDYRNYQALIYTLGLEQLIINANARHKGAETEVEWVPGEAWHLGLGLAYVDATVAKVAGRCCTAQGSPVFGNYVPGNAPRWSGNAMISYAVPVGSGHLAFQADGNYLSRFWFNLSDVPAVEQGGYGIANARLTYGPDDGRLEVGVAVENIANRHFAVMGFDNTSINGLAQRYPGMPRWWKIHFNFHF